MQQRAHATWVIFLTFFIAYLLAIVPFPQWGMNYRPEWVPMVLIYWAMALPYRIGIGFAWFAGLILDCLLYTSPSPRDATLSRMPASA